MDTLYTFWDNNAHYKTESVYFWGLMNSATKRVFTVGGLVVWNLRRFETQESWLQWPFLG